MATSRRPLVVIGGSVQELPEGDIVAGINRFLPFLLANGTVSNIKLLVTTGALPFLLANGSTSNIPVVA
jgi:hypothetical protein